MSRTQERCITSTDTEMLKVRQVKQRVADGKEHPGKQAGKLFQHKPSHWKHLRYLSQVSKNNCFMTAFNIL